MRLNEVIEWGSDLMDEEHPYKKRLGSPHPEQEEDGHLQWEEASLQ